MLIAEFYRVYHLHTTNTDNVDFKILNTVISTTMKNIQKQFFFLKLKSIIFKKLYLVK